jgi:cytochrome c
MRTRLYALFLSFVSASSISVASADDASKGRDLFLRNCIGCHAFACNKEGPSLGGLFGRKAAGAEGFSSYTQDLKDSGIVWTESTLDDFFSDPAKISPDSVMASFGKMDDAEQRRQMIAFLKTEDPSVNICPQ